MNKAICPFCKEVTTAESLVGFIEGFLSTVGNRATLGDPNSSAAVMEMVQLFEMEHESSPALIRRVYKMIAEDKNLGAKMQRAVDKRLDWPRDMAGFFFRIHSAAAAGELKGLSGKSSKRLKNVVETIFRPFESSSPVDLDPHFYGALYSQALVSWLCTWRSGMDTSYMAEIVRRCGRVLVLWKRKRNKPDWRRARDRFQVEVFKLSHEPVWGSREKDIVFQTFCRS